MNLSFGVLSSSRTFRRAVRRIRARLRPLLDGFEAIELLDPVFEGIIVGITDMKALGFFEEVENNDGFYQVFCGCSEYKSDSELIREIFEIFRRTTRECPFSRVDHDRIEMLFVEYEKKLLED